ncbi:S8 family serine peptidase [Tunicatimonas pelagia]|uniref:S8 family serine peptidase n=1 Tax=Tunicatimonas pelagia TaxID=931531 RepID=UPI002665118F|nr:S8 family serine peptidase [Tunicatimonas pelagia]WKN41308.1 S8 family serine peptidase [Tunicatimonas pelagia]
MMIFGRIGYQPFIFLFFIGFFLAKVNATQAQSRTFRLPTGISEADYLPGEIVLKIRSQSSPSTRTARSSLSVLRQVREITQTQQITSVLDQPSRVAPLARQEPTAQIYRLHTERDVVATINQLLQLGEVVYAEPYYLLKPLNEYIPNDPEAAKNGQQRYLESVQAYEAWAIERSNSDMLIGYLDTGVEFGHQDLTDNLYRNEADPINGIDDDGDGYIDNYVGWDFADNDNDPTADEDPHGTMVTGVGSASADNRVGMAGLGFNASYMPIKIFRSKDGRFGFGYEAIAYAADQGCKVINLSWGGANAYSEFGQDMINYAVLEKDAVVVAAAGNSGKQEDFYPAAFNNVLSVAMANNEGGRVANTTSSYFVDLVAPGSSTYTTKNDDGYGSGSGSSFASPMVAGAAALVRSKYPDLSAPQVMEIMRLSAKDVSDVTANQGYDETLGAGLLQAAQALKPIESPALRMTDFACRNHAGPYAYYGDTLTIRVDMQNLLSTSTANTQIILSSVSEYVTVLDSVFRPGAIDSLGTVSNTTQPFRVVLRDDLPASEQLYFRLGLEDGTYQDYQYFFIVSSSNYPSVTKNDLQITVGNQGEVAFDPSGFSVGSVRYQNQAVATEAGLLIGIDSAYVSDNFINDFTELNREQDFQAEDNIRFTKAAVPAYQLRSAFSDANATNSLSLRVEQTWLADTISTENYIISEYRVVNRADSTLTDVSVGLFTNWNLDDRTENRTGWDATYSLAYSYSTSEETYAGLALLTNQTANHQPLNLQSLNGNTSDIGADVSEREKYDWAAQGVNSSQAGTNGAGNDVAQVLAATVDSILENQGQVVAFAWVAGSSLAELQSAATKAQAFYADYQNEPALLTTVLVCTDSTATIQLADDHRFYQDALGATLLTEGQELTTTAITQDTALYAASLAKGYEERIKKINVLIREPRAAFSVIDSLNPGWQNDTLFLDETKNYVLNFQDESLNAVAWEWNFGNGFRSTQQHPQTTYIQTGTYTVQLTVTSSPGCRSTLSKEITVVQRAIMPQLENKLICRGESVSLQATNTALINVFADASLTELLFEGEQFTTEAINQDDTLYVVNAAEEFDSRPLPVIIKVWQPDLQIRYALDTIDLSNKYRLNISLTGDTRAITQYTWLVNDIEVSQQAAFAHNFSDSPTEDWRLTLIYEVDSADLNCTYTLEENIIRTQAEEPELSPVRICQGEAVTVSPENGELFYFYPDASLATPIYAGRRLLLDSVAMNTTIYITNLDGLIESKATAVSVEINRFADFKTLSDTIYLSEPNMAVLQAFPLNESDSSINWQWDLGDGNFAYQAARVTPQFDSVGVYPVRLLATRSDGCTNLVSKTLVVRNVASTQIDPEDRALKIYPNPVQNVFYLENLLWYQKNITLSLLSPEGQVVLHHQLFYGEFPLPVDVPQPLRQGIYVLRLQRDNKVFYRKLLVH